MSNLIEVKQLPVIEQQLKTVSEEIDVKVQNATSLVCTEETVKTIKELRADLNKELKEYETQRKTVKEQVLKPYNEFESIYKQYISDKFKNADIILKERIDTVENELKAKKEQEVKEYFEEYKTSKNIDFIKYEQAKINVTLSASMKSLKEQAKTFIDKIADDLKLIDTQEHKTEILVEYKQTLNVSNSIMTVTNRIKAIEKEKELQNLIVEETRKPIETVSTEQQEFNKQMQDTQINQKKYTITFTVTETSVRLKQLKDYLVREGYQYE